MHRILVHPDKEHVSHINNLIAAHRSRKLAGAFATAYAVKALDTVRDGNPALVLIGPLQPIGMRTHLASDIRRFNHDSIVLAYGHHPQERDRFDGHFPLAGANNSGPLIWLLSRDWSSVPIDQIRKEVRFLETYQKAEGSHQ